MLPREELLKAVENRDSVARVIDQADQAIKTWEVVLTDFFSPPELAEIQRAFGRLTEVQLVASGGYPQAERQRLAIAREEVPIEQGNVEVAALEIAGNFAGPWSLWQSRQRVKREGHSNPYIPISQRVAVQKQLVEVHQSQNSDSHSIKLIPEGRVSLCPNLDFKTYCTSSLTQFLKEE